MITTPARSITQAASSQTYYTIRWLADRNRVEDAFRAYAYFRWVDDILDADSDSQRERRAFIERQKSLLENCYQGSSPREAGLQENMLIELVRHDREKNSGLQSYLRNMMRVMDFDAGRRGRLISQFELNEYTSWLARAVTECIHYFVGHDGYAPRDATRYLAVAAAHITHMLRDTFDDVHFGYYNVPRELLETNRIAPQDVQSDAYRAWVKSRVLLAREYFRAGKRYFARVANPRCRLACFAYIARFEWLLDTIEREDYRLRPQYAERKGLETGLRMGWLTASSMIARGADPAITRSAFPHRSQEALQDISRKVFGK
ncbi:MAG TPA: squalene/phytoene synthase family protein [Anaerolineales bacterium]|nr:squalene/phytoene synthase family protein [Anaerolineales bacterium]